MKWKKSLILAACTFFVCTTNVCNAELISYTSGPEKVVYSTIDERYWIWNMSPLVQKTFDEQNAAVDLLYNSPSYYGYKNWHIATYEEWMTSLGPHEPDDIYYAFGLPWFMDYIGRTTTVFWSQDEPQGPDRYAVRIYQWDASAWEPVLMQIDYVTDSYVIDTPVDYGARVLGAWVTSNTPVPEPATSLLLAAGIAGMAVFRKKTKKY